MTAIFGLYQAAATAGSKVDATVASKLGCQLVRAGKIVAQDGDIGLPKPDAFVMVACAKPILGSSGALLDRLVSGAKRIALYEGNITAAAPNEPGKSAGDRQYIVKVSVFNSTDPRPRERDLAEINALVAKSRDGFKLESAIDVRRALGARRPDEVTVVY